MSNEVKYLDLALVTTFLALIAVIIGLSPYLAFFGAGAMVKSTVYVMSIVDAYHHHRPMV